MNTPKTFTAYAPIERALADTLSPRCTTSSLTAVEAMPVDSIKAGRFSRLRSFMGVTLFVLVIAASIPTVIGPILTQGDRWNVVSGSMEPSIMVGDMTVSHKVDSADVEVGDVLVYQHPDVPMPVTHRVVDIRDGGFILRGDANFADDAPVSAEQIMGKMSYQVPKMGYVARVVEDNRPLLMVAYAGMITWFIVGGRRKKSAAAKDGDGSNE